jgi:hypothetical protein
MVRMFFPTASATTASGARSCINAARTAATSLGGWVTVSGIGNGAPVIVCRDGQITKPAVIASNLGIDAIFQIIDAARSRNTLSRF